MGISCNSCTDIFVLVCLQILGPLPKSYLSNCGFNLTYKCSVLQFDKTVMSCNAAMPGISSLREEGMADSLNLRYG